MLCAATVILVGCGSDVAGPGDRVDGTWQLRSVNGALPYSVTQGSTTSTVTGSVLTIATNGTYNEVLAYRITSGASTTTGTQTELGTWTAVNGAITFHDQTDNTTYQGSVTGGTLTEIVNGFTQVYDRK